jgi:hypothetical protein
MERLTESILERVTALPEGAPVSAKMLLHLGTRPAIDQSLSRLARRGRLLRADRGVYVSPVVILAAIGSAVPVRLMKRDLLFVLEKLVSVMDESRVETLARQHGIRQNRDDGGIAKTLTAFLRRADEGTLSRMLVESSILLAATRGNPAAVLKDAVTAYKVDTDAITAKVKQEFAAKEKAKKTAQPIPKATKKAA